MRLNIACGKQRILFLSSHLGYEGHAVLISDPIEKKRTTEKAMALLVATSNMIRKSGIPLRVVSGGGTGTYAISGKYTGVTEIQAGSYLTMDSQYHENVGIKEFNYAMTLITTVIHVRGARAITDAGIKSLLLVYLMYKSFSKREDNFGTNQEDQHYRAAAGVI